MKKNLASAKPKLSRIPITRNSGNTKRRPSTSSIRIIWSSSRPNTRATPANSNKARTTRNQSFDRSPVANRASMTTRLSTAKTVLMVWTGLRGRMAMMEWTASTAHTSSLRHQISLGPHPLTAHPTSNATASFPSPEARQNLQLPRPTRLGDPTNLLPRCITTRANPLFPPTKTRARSLLLTQPLRLLLQSLLPMLLPVLLPPLSLLSAHPSTLVRQTSLLRPPIQLSPPSTP
jgi:hypothetical protein